MIICQIPMTLQNKVHEINPEQGYVKIELVRDILHEFKTSGWNFDEEFIDSFAETFKSPDGYFQPFQIKSLVKGEAEYGDRGGLLLLAASVFGVNVSDVEIKQAGKEVTKSSVKSAYFVKSHGRNMLKVSLDLVVLLKLSWRPEIVKSWFERSKNWPNDFECEKLLSSGIRVIPKPSRRNKHDENSTEMRFAFSHIERKLVKMRSPEQNFVYMVFKIMFVKWVKPIDTEEISSFIAKTAMFWIAEEFPPEDSVWDVFDEDSLMLPLQILFSWLLSAFECGFVPYYFNEKVNIIEGMSDTIRDQIKTKLEEIVGNIGDFIPSNIEKELRAAETVLGYLSSIKDTFLKINSKDYSALVSQHGHLVKDIWKYLTRTDCYMPDDQIMELLSCFGLLKRP
ncbi:uncharacterized protein [Clytia hemisphaerica]